MRPLKTRAPQAYGSIHEAFARLIDAIGGFEAAALHCNRSKSMLHNYANPNEPDKSVPLHVAITLESKSSEKPLTEFMALSANKLVIDLPESDKHKLSWLGHISRLSDEFSDIIKQTSKFLEDDNDIDMVEARSLLKEIDEMLIVIANMRSAVEVRSKQAGRSAA